VDVEIGIIGAGRVGRALGTRSSTLGHAVRYGVRDPGEPRHDGLTATAGTPTITTVSGAVDGADVALVALPWYATEAVTTTLDMGDAVVIDATNPRAAGDTDPHSGAERLARWTGSDRVVKAFNTTGSANMTDPAYPGGTPAMFLAGDDPDACDTVATLAAELGFDPVRIGGLDTAADLEHLASIWIRLAYPLGHGPGLAFALLRR
jgi:predicted dinucleotide-binding enzyme